MQDEAMKSWARAAQRIARLEEERASLLAEAETPEVDRAALVAELDFLIDQEKVLQRRFLWVASAPSPLPDE